MMMVRRNVIACAYRLRSVAVTLCIAHAVALPRTAVAQSAGPQRASRAQLSERVASLESQLAGNSLKGSARTAAQSEVGAIRLRLQTGDFRVGDRFVLTLRQDVERTDTVSVRDSLKAAVLNLPEINLAGVLRSELEDRMSAHVARFLRNASVKTSVLTRVAVTGAVLRPGFIYVAPDRPINDLVTLAGGPAPTANLDQIIVHRGSAEILSAKASKRVVKEGRTLESLDVQSGDEVRVPTKRKINWQLVIQLFFIVSSLFFAFIQFLQWYYGRQDG